MASKKKTKKKVNSKVISNTNDLFVEMSSGVPASDFGAPAEYTWTVCDAKSQPGAFVTGLIGGTMMGSLAAVFTLLAVRLFT
jgi:hypothetical protein